MKMGSRKGAKGAKNILIIYNFSRRLK